MDLFNDYSYSQPQLTAPGFLLDPLSPTYGPDRLLQMSLEASFKPTSRPAPSHLPAHRSVPSGAPVSASSFTPKATLPATPKEARSEPVVPVYDSRTDYPEMHPRGTFLANREKVLGLASGNPREA